MNAAAIGYDLDGGGNPAHSWRSRNGLHSYHWSSVTKNDQKQVYKKYQKSLIPIGEREVVLYRLKIYRRKSCGFDPHPGHQFQR